VIPPRDAVVVTPVSMLGGLVLVSLSLAVPAPAEDVRAAVDAGNRAFTAAFVRGDAKAVSELYTEDAQVIAPGAPVARGRAAIAAAWQKAMESVTDVRLDTADVESAGDLAYETGTVQLTGKGGAVTKQRYLVVWKRTNDGRWKLHRDIWNSE
jgi:uncharacterized protein (TIGR02246 family)